MKKTRVLVDTGPLVSLLNEREHKHVSCVEALKGLRLPLLTCLPVVTEVSHLLRPYRDALRGLLGTSPEPLIEVLPFDLIDVRAALEIVGHYADQDFDFADACLMHLAEREGIDTVFTLDRKDFLVFLLAGRKPLTLVSID